MGRSGAILLAAQLLLAPAAVEAQLPVPPPGSTTVTTPGIPGNPNQPADFANNPHPTMPWLVTSPYGVVQRWVWMPPQPVSVDGQTLYEPGYWVAQTTAGYYYPTRWVLRQTSPGSYAWVLINGGAVPFAR